MTTPRRVTRQARFNKKDFSQRLTQFLVNKAMAEQAVLRNDGDEKKGVEGLKGRLKEEVMKHGEVDPESGSYILVLDDPIDIPESGQRFSRVVAQRSQGKPFLNVEKAREMLEEKNLLDEVEEFTYMLRLPAERAEAFAEWLSESEMDQYLSADPQGVLIEDKLLALHQRRTLVEGQKEPVRLITEEELDSLYDTPEPSYSFRPMTK